MILHRLKPQETLGDRVYRLLLEAIINKEMPPGQHLVIDELASKIGTSGTPIREALNRLQQEGLVVKNPNQGWKIREFTITETIEIYQVRAALECMAVKLCCQKPLAADVHQRLIAIQKEGDQAIKENDLARYRLHNDEFHDVILEVAGNQTLRDVMNTLRHRVRLFSETTIRVAGRPKRAVREHGQLIEFMVAGDEVQAEALMEQHILSALEDLLERQQAMESP
jgi:DNA-binding GntR family transcriptional regulator